MAKLRGKHTNYKEVRNTIIKLFDEMFPKDAPHHIVVMGDKEYSVYDKKQGEFYMKENGVQVKLYHSKKQFDRFVRGMENDAQR